ncbi:hypothetical protein ACIP02_10400 [Pseudomonas sp. NPDC089408]|uniref:hypothetical protein n=1 Tax=Pseudomonas sp. NPDC089408 TaxID=3364465 RepID=UPI0038290BFF
MKKTAVTQRMFYCNGKLVTLTDNEKATRICRTADVALAELHADGYKLLETDAMGSVLRVHEKD